MGIEIIPDMSIEDYHKTDAVGKSVLDNIHKSPAHMKAAKDKIPGPPLILGSALHCAVLEHETFNNRFIVEPDIDKRTKAGKEEYAVFLIAMKKKGNPIILTQNQLDVVNKMTESLSNHPRIKSLFENGQPETSIFWEENTLPCKCRPDWIINKGEYVIDLKTTQDASPEGFAKSMANYRYHVQDAWYSRGVQVAYGQLPKAFIFLAVENKPPHNVGIYSLNQDSKDEGWMVARHDLDKYRDYIKDPEEDRFDGYSRDVVELSLPKWAFTQF